MLGDPQALAYTLIFMLAAAVGWAFSHRDRSRKTRDRADFIRSLTGRN